jgi:Gpi18-like mannosyltransferase
MKYEPKIRNFSVLNQINKGSIFNNHPLVFPCSMWLLSRALIAIAMLVIAPLLPAPPGGIQPDLGWGVFWDRDSEHYQNITFNGYEYINDGKAHNVAFFPLFPLLIRTLMSLSLPFELSGVLVNNLAFLGALIVLYIWIQEHHGNSIARWTTAFLAWCPLSLFGTVIYTEGLFLFLSIAALRAFDRRQYLELIFWGVLTTATRPTALIFAPALLMASWQEKRSKVAYLSSLATGLGLLAFSIYCWLDFNDPLAFINAQKAWRASFGFNSWRWGRMLQQIIVGSSKWSLANPEPFWHLPQFLIICTLAYLLWRNRKRFTSMQVENGFATLAIWLWLLAGDPLINVVMTIGGGLAIWKLRDRLTPVTSIYGLMALAMLLASGGTISLNRLTYGIVSVSIAFAMLLSNKPRWGYLVMGIFAILLSSYAVRFAQNLWVA